MKGVARTRQCLYYLGQYRRQYDLEVARPQSGSSCTWFLVELEFGNVGFWGEGKTGVQEEKPLGANERTNNKLYTCMESTPGFAEPRPDWWEASVLTTAASLVPHFWRKIAKFANFSTEQVCELKAFTLERFSVNTTGHVRKMGQFKSKQINFWVLKFFCHSFQMIYITSCAIVLRVFSINSVQICRYFGLLDHIPTTNLR